MDNKPLAYPLTLLIGRELFEVDFVCDYFHLRFNGPYLTVLSNSKIIVNGQSYDHNSPEYNNLLISCIGQTIDDVSILMGKTIEILFSNGITVSISLRSEDYITTEAAIFNDDELKIWNFW
jgi:hypothetical protein